MHQMKVERFWMYSRVLWKGLKSGPLPECHFFLGTCLRSLFPTAKEVEYCQILVILEKTRYISPTTAVFTWKKDHHLDSTMVMTNRSISNNILVRKQKAEQPRGWLEFKNVGVTSEILQRRWGGAGRGMALNRTWRDIWSMHMIEGAVDNNSDTALHQENLRRRGNSGERLLWSF